MLDSHPFLLHIAPPKYTQRYNPEVLHGMLPDPTNCPLLSAQLQKAKQDQLLPREVGQIPLDRGHESNFSTFQEMAQSKTVVSPEAGFGWTWHTRGMSGSKAEQCQADKITERRQSAKTTQDRTIAASRTAAQLTVTMPSLKLLLLKQEAAQACALQGLQGTIPFYLLYIKAARNPNLKNKPSLHFVNFSSQTLFSDHRQRHFNHKKFRNNCSLLEILKI